MILNTHYRGPLTFNDQVAQQAQRALERIRTALRPAASKDTAPTEAEGELGARAEDARAGFEAAMDDDFNTPSALASLFDLVRGINNARDAGAGEGPLGMAQAVLVELTDVLGLQLAERPATGQAASPFIDLLAIVRQELRSAKQWELADRIRDRLEDMGVVLEDGKDGSAWRFR